MINPNLKQLPWKRLLWWGRVILTIALMLLLIWQVRSEIGTLRVHLARPLALIVALASIVLAILLSTWLWYGLIPPQHREPFRQLLARYLLGLFWNNFLPGGIGGDIVRAMSLGKSSKHSGIAVTSVLMTRVASLWSTTLLANIAAVTYIGQIGWQETAPFLLIAVCTLLITIGGTVFLLGLPRSWLVQHLPAQVQTWCNKLRIYRQHPQWMLHALGRALLIQLCAVLINTCVVYALDLSITPGQLLLSMPLITLSTALPITLGGFGIREGAYLFFLGLLGVAVADALLLALVVYALLTLVTSASAGFCILS